jgi:hypothetical protein
MILFIRVHLSVLSNDVEIDLEFWKRDFVLPDRNAGQASLGSKNRRSVDVFRLLKYE